MSSKTTPYALRRGRNYIIIDFGIPITIEGLRLELMNMKVKVSKKLTKRQLELLYINRMIKNKRMEFKND